MNPGIDRVQIRWGFALVVLLGWAVAGRADPFRSRFDPLPLSSLLPIAQASPATAEKVPAEVQGWFDEAAAAYTRGAYAEALELQEKVLTWVKSHLGSRHAFRAQVLNDLGLFASKLGRHHEALPPTEEAVRIYRELVKTNPAFRVDLARSLSNLGALTSGLGRRAEALPPTEEAVRITRELVKTNPAFQGDLARSLSNLGALSSELGRRAEALPPTEEAVRIYRELAQANPAFRGDLARSLSNLGVLSSELGRRAEALPPTEEAVRIYRELAKTNPAFRGDLARSLSNLGKAYNELGRPAEALPPTEEAVRIFRELAKTNPAFQGDLAMTLNNLGDHHSKLGQRAEALPPTEEAVRIYRQLAETNPAFLPELAISIQTIADLILQTGQRQVAEPLLREMVKSQVEYLQGQLPLLPEAQRQKLIDTFGSRWQTSFSLAGQSQGGTSVALFTRLNRQGLLLDIERRQALLARASGSAATKVRDLRRIVTQLTVLSLDQAERKELQRQREQREQELYRLLPPLEPRLVEPADVAGALPQDGVLVEFQRFQPFDASEPEDRRWQDPRYLALVLRPDGATTAVDLGPAEGANGIDAAIRAALAATQMEHPDAGDGWRNLAERVLGPLRPHLEGSRRWFLSPDGSLNLLPFPALPALMAVDGPSADSVEVHLLTSGRDLLADPGSRSTSSRSLVLASPAYRGWPQLPATAEEGRQVATLLGATLRQGSAASVAALRQVRGPLVLHVASYGYFDTAMASEDPMLAGAIVLAGADRERRPGKAGDDGYLTAAEAAQLQLEGTELAVLASCESGTGRVQDGEGLYGLRRALAVAGARSTLLSLWKVDDEATAWFMRRYYTRLLSGEGRLKALQAVQQEFRTAPKLPGWSHPYYWAAWQLSGDVSPLPQ